jgi:hypothetical protein
MIIGVDPSNVCDENLAHGPSSRQPEIGIRTVHHE